VRKGSILADNKEDNKKGDARNRVSTRSRLISVGADCNRPSVVVVIIGVKSRCIS
jgi:hypothetical protein